MVALLADPKKASSSVFRYHVTTDHVYPIKKKKKHEVNVPSCYVSKHTASVAFYLPASKYSDDYGHKHMKSLGLFNAYIQQDIHLGRLLLSDLSFDIIRKSTCLRCKPNFNSHNDLAI